ncbi:MAG TPA: hypothetical protein VK540_33465 [Polyangiaceae bacterium]|nr:hypothetical protein [Polyangiaceae bacterium]
MSPRIVLPGVLASLLLLGSTGARADCGCSGNPGTITSDAAGPCLRYAAPSGAANDITFRFAEAYGCGAYATGEFFVVANGTASITAISPNASGGRHGVDVNPAPGGPQRWDDRLAGNAAPIALPYAAPPGSSVVKYVSDNPAGACDGTADEKSCGRFAAVVTVVSAAPGDPGHAFRPPFVGAYKPTLSSNDLKRGLLSRLNRGSCRAPTLETARAWTSHLRLDYTSDSVTCDLMPPEDALPEGRPWSTDIWAHDTDVYAWLHLANVCATPPCTPEQDLQAKLPVLVGYVQHGIDIWSVDRLGASLFRGGGGNGGGKLFAYAFAAAMLGDPDMLANLAAVQANHFFETASYYTGKSGVALWGQPTGSEREYWNDFSSKSTRTIRDPYGFIDGGFEPGGWYQDNTAKPTQYSALLMRVTPALQSVWPVNKDAILAYADRWVQHGALTLPDPCAPVGGTYGTNYGSDGRGGCIAGSGRVAALDGANRNGGNRERPLGECMWATFRACAESCSCEGQSCTAGPRDGGTSGSGGASGSAGTSGRAGAGGESGGASGGAGAGGRAGAAGSGGANGRAGANGNAGASGTGGADGGSGGASGMGGADRGTQPEGTGCGCRIARVQSRGPSLWMALSAALALAWRRRRHVTQQPRTRNR